MRINFVNRWIIRQSLGAVRGTRLIGIIEALRPEDIDSLERLLEILRRRTVLEILDDLILLEQIDKIIYTDPFGGDR